MLAIVVDGGGHSCGYAGRLAPLEIPLAEALLPKTSYLTETMAARAAQKHGGMTVICRFRSAAALFLGKLNVKCRELPIDIVTLPDMAEKLRKKNSAGGGRL